MEMMTVNVLTKVFLRKPMTKMKDVAKCLLVRFASIEKNTDFDLWCNGA